MAVASDIFDELLSNMLGPKRPKTAARTVRILGTTIAGFFHQDLCGITAISAPTARA